MFEEISPQLLYANLMSIKPPPPPHPLFVLEAEVRAQLNGQTHGEYLLGMTKVRPSWLSSSWILCMTSKTT